MEGHNKAKAAGKEEMCKGQNKQEAVKSLSCTNQETF